ncbi:acetylserotonin O-methyltransferase-like isoform X2 [Pseudophryne corroboree]|uniref:acetylserotonin O-methyltransferase-like isoform X2 n=1 Tax=Pseudophryne corroboree TaxID=495146 RepID=UPI0030820C20
MSSTEDPDYPQQLLNYRDGFIVSKAMFTACELGVFDLLHELGEPLTTATIASRLCTSVDGTDRLLTACVGLKLLKVELKNDEAYYSNTDLSTTYLVKSSPKTMYPMMMYCTNTAYICWQFLPEAIREGKCQYERAFGVSSEDLFNAIYRSEEMLVTFMGFMDSISNNFGKYALQAFDLSTFHTVCDLGGCSGSIAKQYVSTYPGSNVTIMDLPKVIQTAKRYFITDSDQHISLLEGYSTVQDWEFSKTLLVILIEAEVDCRVSLSLMRLGDFFTDPIPEADLFILSSIIHDWTEEKCHHLLKKVYQSCRPGGGVLLIEHLLNEDKSGPVASQLFSLYMLVLTEGRERTPSEYTKLLTDCGFRDIQVKSTGTRYDAILGRKLQ